MNPQTRVYEAVAAKMVPMPPPEAQTAPQNHDKRTQVKRVVFRRADFFNFGFTDGCLACQVTISGRVPERGGNKYANSVVQTADGGHAPGHPGEQEVLQRYIDKGNEAIAREMERGFR